MTRTFAQDTSVPITRSRAEIDALLCAWGCDGTQWSDDYRKRTVALRFVWSRGDAERYSARLTLRFPSPADVKAKYAAEQKAKHGWGRDSLTDTRAEREADQAARAGHRVLLLWIKAALNAVAAGLLTAEEVFLPHMEGADGRTVAEVALPRLRVMLGGNADLLLTDGGETERTS